MQVAGLTDVTAVSAGQHHSVALQVDGTIWSWGANDYGQLGDRTTTQRISPVEVTRVPDAVAIAAGQYRSSAVKTDGTVWSSGNNRYGELAIDPGWNPRKGWLNTLVYSVTPVVVGNGSLTPDTVQWVTTGEMVSFTVTPDPDYLIQSVTGCGGTLFGDIYITAPVSADCTVTATFFQIIHSLSVTVSGLGTVYSSPAPDIQCTDNCTQDYIEGTLVTLTAVPQTNNSFSGWTGDCTGTGDCVLEMTAAKSVTADFFVSNIPFPVLLESTQGTYLSMQSAYDAIVSGQSDTVKVKAGEQTPENLYLDRDVSARIQGGYDNVFTDIISATEFFGSLTVVNGSVIVSELIIK